MNHNPRSKSGDDQNRSSGSDFLPDLCKLNAVFFMLVSTQLFALVITLMTSRMQLVDWEFLGLLSIYCHCIVLSCATVICQSHPLLREKSAKQVTGYCLLAIVSVAGLFAWIFVGLIPLASLNLEQDFILRSIIISAILGGLLLRYFYLQHVWRLQKQAELDARLQALQARIRPHFLFNSMNTIASLVSIDADRAEEAILDLSELFRATLNNQKMLIPAEEELALCKRYLNIESLRLGDRLQLEWDISQEIRQVKIPPLTLQPLLENAIYHGIQPLTEGGTISIQAYCKGDTAYILISNPVASIQTRHHGNQIALDNISRRLSAIFNHRAIIKTSHQDLRFTVTLRIPKDI